MPRPRNRPGARAATLLLAACALAPALLGGCSRGGGREARERLEARDRPAPTTFDFSRPAEALAMDAGEAARRLGAVDFAATVRWSVVARGPSTAPLETRAAERHEVRQRGDGDFRALAEIDPGTWPGAEQGREVVFAGGKTYARGRYAPFRERPTDRGRDARRFRDESFRLAADVAALFAPALRLEPRGEGSLLGRRTRRFGAGLVPGGALPPAAAGGAGAEADPDTRLRADFVAGRVPLSLEGELELDADTGVPLSVRLRGALGHRADPQLRTQVELDARVTGWGALVGPVAAPAGALPDERKPRGVARALEQAGLRKREAAKAADEAADDEAPEPEPQ